MKFRIGIIGAATLAGAFLTYPAVAACPTFHVLTNGSTADADQVMDNFSNIVACPKFNGRVDISKTNNTIDTSPATASLAIDNPAGSQSLVDFSFGSAVRSMIRADSSGNLILSASGALISIGDTDVSTTLTPISLQTGAIYIDQFHNVGIGTTTPGAPFTVAGQIRANTNFGANAYAEQVRNSIAVPMVEIAPATFNSSNNYYMQVAPGAAGSDKTIDFISNWSGYVSGGVEPAFNFKKYDNTSWLYIKNNGNVGLGTTSPAVKLDVEGVGAAPATSGTISTAITRIRATNTNVVLDSGALPGAPWTFWQQATDSAHLNSIYPLSLNPNGGNVGIGTTSPAEALEVNGRIKVDTLASASGTALCINANVISSCSSSLRYKENVKSAIFGLREVLAMRPVTFKWKGRGEDDFGLIAEEVAKINRLFVTYKAGQIEGVKYPQLVAVLVGALKEQEVQIASLKKSAQESKLEREKQITMLREQEQKHFRALAQQISDMRARLKTQVAQN